MVYYILIKEVEKMSEEDFNKIFSRNLRFFLNKYDMSQAELAKRIGVGTTSVYNWFNGLKTPRMDKVDSMCKIFNCKRSDLIESRVQKEATAKTPKILESYNQLNALGKQEAEKRVQELTYIPKYTTPDDHLILQAAHERTDIEITDEMRKHDDDIMNDENF
jgi:transcriptional regulator with XRE-family HTH domain